MMLWASMIAAAMAAPTWTRFDDGLQLVTESMDGPDVTVVVRVATGWNDDGDTPGMAHLAEHLWFRSLTPGGHRVWDDLQARGCSPDATTSDRATTFMVRCPRVDTDFLLAEVQRFLTDPLAGVEQALVDVESAIVTREQAERWRDRSWQTPMLEALLEDAQPMLARLAPRQLTAAPDRATVRSWVAEHWTPDRTVVGVVGPAVGAEVMERGAGTPGAPSEDAESLPPEGEPHIAGPVIQIQADVPRGLLLYGWRLPRWAVETGVARYAASHIEAWLSVGMFREDEEVESVGCSTLHDDETPVLLCVVESIDRIDKAVVEAARTGARFSMAGPGADGFLERLGQAGDGVERRLAAAMSTSSARASLYTRQIADGYAPGTPRYAPVPKKLGTALTTWLNMPNGARVVVHPSGELFTHPTLEVEPVEPAPLRAEALPPARAPYASGERLLDNGLRIVAVQRPEDPLTTGMVRFFSGLATRPYGKAILIEAMADAPEAVGTVSTGERHSLGHVDLLASALPQHTSQLLKTLYTSASERHNGVAESPESVKQRDVLLRLWRSDLAPRDGWDRASRWLTDQVVPGHAPSRPISKAELDALEDLLPAQGRAYGHRVWRPDRAAVVLVGPLPVEEMLDGAQRRFARWQATPNPPPPPPPMSTAQPARGAAGRVFDEPRARHATATLSCRLPDGLSREDSVWLQTYTDARLWEELRASRGRIYTPRSGVSVFPDGTRRLQLSATLDPALAPSAPSWLQLGLGSAADAEATFAIVRDQIERGRHMRDRSMVAALTLLDELRGTPRPGLDRASTLAALEQCRATASWAVVVGVRQVPPSAWGTLEDAEVAFGSGEIRPVVELVE